MERMSNIVKSAVLGLMLSVAAATGTADSDLCAPFENGVVQESIVAKMLASAKDGHLYRIKPSSSRVGFCVDSPVGRVEGRFKDFKGGLTFVPTAVAAGDQQAMVMVDTKSLETGAPLIEGMLKGEQFFDVNKYPEILFVSQQFRWVNSSEAVLIGDLTLHGVTRQVGFHVQLIRKDQAGGQRGEERILVKATTLISRAEFGLNAMSTMVGDAVSLCMSVDAVRYRAI
jgi:polyisoprenoid-binding protein YceI